MLICSNLNAGVNLKNGNFYISYTDLELLSPSAALTAITRTYNSKSTSIGPFGYGWGVKFETHLFAYPDGAIVIKEYGSGSTTIYNSSLITDEMIEEMIDLLIEIEIQEGIILNTPESIIERRNKLSSNSDLKYEVWDRYVLKNLLDYNYDMPVGMTWDSFERGNERLEKIESGFKRSSGSTIQYFDHSGNLVKLEKSNGVFSKFEYLDNRIARQINADGSEIYFKTNSDGYIIEISSNLNNQKAIFKYNGDDLVYAKDVVGNEYVYEYNNRHDMTRIIYNISREEGEPIDAKSMEYEDKTGYISKITDRNGDVTYYNYHVYYNEDGSKDNNHYGTSVTKVGWNGKNVTNTYEWYIGVKSNGERYSKIIETNINGVKTKTTYDEICALPIEIIRGNRKTTFKYNNRCLMIEKDNGNEQILTKYHPTLEKITYVKNNEGETFFEYDDRGNLIHAKSSNDWVKLYYDDNGKIEKMSQSDKILIFKYNDIGKPISIEIEGEGSIQVEYDKYGEITKVHSEEGHSMAAQVTKAFQNLLSLVKPAGVNLGL